VAADLMGIGGPGPGIGRKDKKGGLMNAVEITRATVAGGRRVVPGEVVELIDADARALIALGKAVPVVNAPVVDNREKDAAKKISKRTAAAPTAAPAEK
jgi:hypothetical protein